MPKILIVILTLIFLFLIFIITDSFFSKPVAFTGLVVDKHYKAESVRTGTGIVNTTQGVTGIVTTTEWDPEEFLIMVKTDNGNVVTAKCKPELYYAKEKGQPIDCYWSKGYFTGWQWSVYCLK